MPEGTALQSPVYESCVVHSSCIALGVAIGFVASFTGGAGNVHSEVASGASIGSVRVGGAIFGMARKAGMLVGLPSIVWQALTRSNRQLDAPGYCRGDM
jgi:hypothetical protein